MQPLLERPVVDLDVLPERDLVPDEACDPQVRLAGEPPREDDLAEDPKMVIADSFANRLQTHKPPADRPAQGPSRDDVPGDGDDDQERDPDGEDFAACEPQAEDGDYEHGPPPRVFGRRVSKGDLQGTAPTAARLRLQDHEPLRSAFTAARSPTTKATSR